MILRFKDHTPVVHTSSFVHPLATVTGNVIIGKHCYIGPGAALRGDWGGIVLEDGVNVQENCTVHMFPGKSVVFKTGVHVGHGAVVHGANLGKNCLVGMNSVIMDGAIIGDECIVGAMAYVRAGAIFVERQLIVGNPAKAIKEVSDKMIAWKTAGTKLYQQLPTDCHKSLREVPPCAKSQKTGPCKKTFIKHCRNTGVPSQIKKGFKKVAVKKNTTVKT